MRSWTYASPSTCALSPLVSIKDISPTEMAPLPSLSSTLNASSADMPGVSPDSFDRPKPCLKLVKKDCTSLLGDNGAAGFLPSRFFQLEPRTPPSAVRATVAAFAPRAAFASAETLAARAAASASAAALAVPPVFANKLAAELCARCNDL